MHLASVSKNRPWVCNVWFASDEALNIYWLSSINRRHSAEIAQNNRVAGALCLPQTPQDKPRGLQFEGMAEVLEAQADVQEALNCYVDRIFSLTKIRELMEHPERPHKFYRIRPELFVLFDAVNFPDNPRQEWRPQNAQT